MLKFIIAFGISIAGTAQFAASQDAAYVEYKASHLKIEACFVDVATDREACVVEGIQRCVNTIEAVLESKGLDVPGGAAISPAEHCSAAGRERADAHLNTVYQRILAQGPLQASNSTGIPNLRAAQRLWLQFATEMCSEENIVDWHAGGSGWSTVTNDCITRLSVQQADHLARYFTIDH